MSLASPRDIQTRVSVARAALRGPSPSDWKRQAPHRRCTRKLSLMTETIRSCASTHSRLVAGMNGGWTLRSLPRSKTPKTALRMSKRMPVVWDAAPHTIAKIAILRGYLKAWFRILGCAGPGKLFSTWMDSPAEIMGPDDLLPMPQRQIRPFSSSNGVEFERI